MENLESGDITFLRENVEKKFGRKIQYAKDCTELSQAVLDSTGCKVSETTIKRFWNMVASATKPSKYTLNSFAIYLGYKSLEELFEHKDAYQKSAENLQIWTNMREKAAAISRNTLTDIKNSLGISLDKTILRTQVLDTIKDFVNSDGPTAYALVASSGMGKTTAMAQAAECALKTSQNDIVCYLDCSGDTPQDMPESTRTLFAQLIGGDGHEALNDYIDHHPATLNGKVLLMLDGVSSSDMADYICDMVYRYRSAKYLKVVIATPTLAWQHIAKNTKEINKDCWYLPEWEVKSTTYHNIPPLSYEESIEALKNCDCFTARNFELLNKSSIRKAFKIPYMLELLTNLKKDNLTEIDIFSDYSNRKVNTSENGYKNQKLIDFILFTTNYGLDTDFAEKKRLTRLIEEYGQQLNGLLDLGVLEEYYVTDRIGERSAMISFSFKEFFEYQIANYWLKEFGLNENMFIEVSAYYTENQSLLERLFGWFIKYAFKERDTELLKSMFQLIELHFQDRHHRNALKELYCTELRYYPELQPQLLRTEAESSFYLQEYVDYDNMNGMLRSYLSDYYKAATDSRQKLLALLLKMYNSLVNCDVASAEDIYNEVSEMDISVSDEYQYMQTLAVQVMYQYTVLQKVDGQLLTHIKGFGTEFYGDFDKSSKEFKRLTYILIDVLVITECYDTAKALLESLFQNEDRLDWNVYYSLLKIEYSYSLLKIGYVKKAKQVFDQYSVRIIDHLPFNSFNYTMMRGCEIAYAFRKDAIYKTYGKYFADNFHYKYYQRKFN